MLVKPGRVFISFTRISPVSFNRKKSTLARPEHSIAAYALGGKPVNFCYLLCSQRSRNNQLRVIGNIFCFIVIKACYRYHFPRNSAFDSVVP